MLRRKTSIVVAAFAVWFTVTAGAQGESSPAVAFGDFLVGAVTRNYYSAGFASQSYSAGWKFTVTAPLTLTHLGVLDWGNASVAASGNGLDVAIYSMDGTTTYASATVTSSDTTTSPAGIDARYTETAISSDFLYHELSSPVTLPIGDYLIISETVTGNAVGNGFGTLVYSPSATTAAGLTYDQQWIRGGISSSAWFDNPGEDSTPGYWGGNFLILVPEPASATLIGLGAVLALRRRRA